MTEIAAEVPDSWEDISEPEQEATSTSTSWSQVVKKKQSNIKKDIKKTEEVFTETNIQQNKQQGNQVIFIKAAEFNLSNITNEDKIKELFAKQSPNIIKVIKYMKKNYKLDGTGNKYLIKTLSDYFTGQNSREANMRLDMKGGNFEYVNFYLFIPKIISSVKIQVKEETNSIVLDEETYKRISQKKDIYLEYFKKIIKNDELKLQSPFMKFTESPCKRFQRLNFSVTFSRNNYDIVNLIFSIISAVCTIFTLNESIMSKYPEEYQNNPELQAENEINLFYAITHLIINKMDTDLERDVSKEDLWLKCKPRQVIRS